MLHEHCADLGRDPGEILLSTHIPYDPADVQATVDTIGSFGEHGLDLAIVYLRPPLRPADLTPLASALATIS